jgi:two-component system, chemotaxis family, CheB/CheR fusion protein
MPMPPKKRVEKRRPATPKARKTPPDPQVVTRTSPEIGTTRQSEITEPAEHSNPVIVGIGASAGGLEAIGELLSHIPTGTNMAFVVVQHLAPAHDSLMTDLLARKTHMKVRQVSDGMRMEANNVYVIPPNSDLGVLHGALQLFNRLDQPRPHLPVDHFFRALAQDQRASAIGVVLSGTGSDGTLGLIAIKAEGGITLAQDPQTAQYDGMPRSAIAAGCIDFVRSPEEIAQELTAIASHPYVRHEADEERVPDSALSKIFFLLRRETGNDFTNYKRTTIARRLNRRMVLHKLSRIEDYVRYLGESPPEVEELFHDLLINVTNFFRDPGVFEALKAMVFPRLMRHRKGEDALRIWVPGCSTGEEAYSIAIALIEYLGRDWVTQGIQIFASDIDNKAIDKARIGFYPENIVAHVSEERLRRFFTAKPGGYQINKSIRDLCVFSTQNAAQDPPFARMDFVACRNVLIYLDATLQRRVLARLHFALKPDGFLLLGSSETVGGSDDLFALADKQNKIYSKKSVQVRLRDLAGIREIEPQETPAKVRPPHARMTRNLQLEAEQLLVRNYGPPTVIIDEAMDIVAFSGRTGPYIEPSPGAVSLKLLKMVHPDLSASLRGVVLRALKQKVTVRADLMQFRQRDHEQFVNLVVTPLQDPRFPEHYYAVIFEAVSKPDPRKQKVPKTDKLSSKDRRIQELTSELESTHNQTQNLVKDYTTAIEELQAANEEIQSSTEEMQSTNEELESAKEELQSTNEELSTLNEELENRNNQLMDANNDLLNLLSNIDLPIVMLSADLCIRRFTPMAKELLNFIDADIGRPIGNIKLNIDIADLPRLVAEVVSTVSGRSVDTQDSTGRWWSVRIRPYRTTDSRIAGVILVCVDITEIRKSLESTTRLATVVRDSNDAVLVQDLTGSICAWNARAERLYGYAEDEALRMNIQQVIPKEAKDAHNQLVQRVLRGDFIAPAKAIRVTKDGRAIPVLLTASLLVDAAGKPKAIATTEREMGGAPGT